MNSVTRRIFHLQNQATLPHRSDLDADDFTVMDDPVRRNAIADANELMPMVLKDVPLNVPSGLPVWE